MKRLFVVAAAASALAMCAGCSHIPFIGKKKPAIGQTVPMNPHVATQVQVDFEARWLDKRTSDLVNAGMEPDAARAQAQAEFDAKYSYTNPAQGITK